MSVMSLLVSGLVSFRVPTCPLECAKLGMRDKARPGGAYSPFIALDQRRRAVAPVESAFSVRWWIENEQA